MHFVFEASVAYLVYLLWPPQISTRTLSLALLRVTKSLTQSCSLFYHIILMMINLRVFARWLMALTWMGLEKTGYFTMHMLLLIALSKDPSIVAPFKLKRKVLANPAMVIVFPTNGVKEEIVCKYNTCAFSLLTLSTGAQVSMTWGCGSSHKHELDCGGLRQGQQLVENSTWRHYNSLLITWAAYFQGVHWPIGA